MQNAYNDDKEPALEEQDDNEMSNDNDDNDSVDDKTVKEQDIVLKLDSAHGKNLKND